MLVPHPEEAAGLEHHCQRALLFRLSGRQSQNLGRQPQSGHLRRAKGEKMMKMRLREKLARTGEYTDERDGLLRCS